MDKASGAYRTISEVADELDIPQHVLRFWETRFPQIKPMKRSGGRRYYRPGDVLLLRGIRRLLYGEGYTIKGVQRILSSQGIAAVQQAGGASGEELALAEMSDTDSIAAIPQAGEIAEAELTSFSHENAPSELTQTSAARSADEGAAEIRETHREEIDARPVHALEMHAEQLPLDKGEMDGPLARDPQSPTVERFQEPSLGGNPSRTPALLVPEHCRLLQAALDELRACARDLDSLRDGEADHQPA
jgi:DNA-binding transcriptional MerR regulator